MEKIFGFIKSGGKNKEKTAEAKKEEKKQQVTDVKYNYTIEYDVVVGNKVIDTCKETVLSDNEPEAFTKARELVEAKFEKVITEQSALIDYTGNFTKTIYKEQ